jgi:Ala-tRNA(Pro) deacylase
MSPKASVPTPKLFERIVELLNSQNIVYKVIEHEPIDGSAAGSSAITGTNPEAGAKTLVMMVDGVKPIMVVLRGPDRVNKSDIKRLTGSRDVRMATPEEVGRITRAELGTLPPIGSLFGIETYVDKHLLEEKKIVFGTGLPTRTAVINGEDFRKLVNPIVGDFVKS